MAKPLFNIKFRPDLRKVAAAYKPIRRGVIDGKMKRLGQIIWQNIVTNAPLVSGNLAKALKLRRLGDSRYEVFIDKRMKGAKYEPFVRLGTPPHSIYPARKKALYWPGLSHPVSMANHPGQKANDYWQRGIDASQDDIRAAEQELADAIKQEIKI